MSINKIFRKPWGKGVVCGFILSVIVAIVLSLGLLEGTAAGNVLQIFGSLPVYVVMKLKLDLPGLFPVFVYFIYWIVLGGFVGWGISQGKSELLSF